MLFKESECLEKTGAGITISKKCSHIEYPNHPQRRRRRECGKELMKTVKVGKKVKFVPHKSYVYYSIIDSVQQLVLRCGFLESCEEWRANKSSIANDQYTDVYDSKLWEDWQVVNSIPYLQVPANLLFMLNIRLVPAI